MHIDFILDTVCAWSYIAKRRLDRAIHSFPRLKASVSVHPFLVSPPRSLSPLGIDSKIDNLIKIHEIRSKIEPAAKEEGLNILFDQLPLVQDSTPSHILVRQGFLQNRGLETLEAVFNAYFCQGKNIGELDVLTHISENCGLDTGSFLNDVSSRSLKAILPVLWRKSGVRGIPCFIFNQKTLISGAQSTEVFKRMIELYLVLRHEPKENTEDCINMIENKD